MRQKLGNISKKIIEILGIIVLIGIAFSYLYYATKFASIDMKNAIIMIILLLFMVVAYAISVVIRKEKCWMLLWVAVVVFITRFATIWISGELYPISDSKMYYDLTTIMAQNGITTLQDAGASEYVAMFPYIVFYPFVMSLFLKVVGVSITHMQFFNLLLNVITGLCLYGLVKQKTEKDSKLPVIAVILWACNPSQFLYAPLLYTEHLCTLFIVALLYVYSKYEGKESCTTSRKILYGVLIGCLAWGAYQSRVAGLIAFIAIVIYEMIRIFINKKPVKDSILVFGVAILVLMIGSKLYSSLVVQSLLQPEHQNRQPFVSYTFYIGANKDYHGGWNYQDASTSLDRLRQIGFEDANSEYWDKLINERLKMDPWDYLTLQVHKFVAFHNPSHSSVEYLSAYSEGIEAQDFTLVTYLFETAIMILLLVKVARKKQFTSYSGLLLLIFIGNTLFNMLVESSGRYSYIEGILLAVLLVEQWNEDYLKLPKAENNEK